MSPESGVAKAFGLNSEVAWPRHANPRGAVVQMIGKLWFLDRMALLYGDVSSAVVPAPPRTDR